MSWPAPTRENLDTFCRREGWQEIRNARGRKVGHHITYELHLPDGRVLRTRISHPPNKQTYAPRMWSHILRDQLCVSEAEFWSCVNEGIIPERGAPTMAGQGVPAQIIYTLIHEAHLSESEVATMDREQAIARVNKFWTEGK